MRTETQNPGFLITSILLAQIFGMNANHDVGETPGNKLADSIGLGIGQGNAPITRIRKAALVQILDGGEYVLSLSNQENPQGSAKRAIALHRGQLQFGDGWV
jgi:hypothetical protein